MGTVKTIINFYQHSIRYLAEFNGVYKYLYFHGYYSLFR
jgi:hypothetical protein